MTIGTNFGRLLASCEATGRAYKVISPTNWKRKAGIKPKVTGKEKKEVSFECCRRTFGVEAVQRMNLRVNSDGQCDALLIGYYGM